MKRTYCIVKPEGLDQFVMNRITFKSSKYAVKAEMQVSKFICPTKFMLPICYITNMFFDCMNYTESQIK